MTGRTLDSNSGIELYCPNCELTFDHTMTCPNDGTRLVRIGAHVDPLVGRELDGRYTILEKLGQGGMGTVYRARQHSVGREVAVKVLDANVTSDPNGVKRFLREVKLAAKLVHPNIVAVLDSGQTPEGVFYLLMELIEGETLHALIHREKRLEVSRVVRIGVQICDALEGAHRLPIVHRDLKPANVMVLAGGRDFIKVVDFGLAKSLAPERSSTTMTSAGALLGTPAFISPEGANGEPCDERADLYSLGCILYLLGSGHAPFTSDSVLELISLHANEPVPPMTGVPAPVALVIDKLLAKRPTDRYPSASATRQALEQAFDFARGVTPRPVRTDADDEHADTFEIAPPPSSAETGLGKTAVFVGPPPAVTLPPPPSGPANVAAARTEITPSQRRSRTAWIIAAGATACVAVAIAVIASRGDHVAAPPPIIPSPIEQPVPARAPAPELSPPPSDLPKPPPPITKIKPDRSRPKHVPAATITRDAGTPSNPVRSPDGSDEPF